jgi:hypothetical protein
MNVQHCWLTYFNCSCSRSLEWWMYKRSYNGIVQMILSNFIHSTGRSISLDLYSTKTIRSIYKIKSKFFLFWIFLTTLPITLLNYFNNTRLLFFTFLRPILFTCFIQMTCSVAFTIMLPRLFHSFQCTFEGEELYIATI